MTWIQLNKMQKYFVEATNVYESLSPFYYNLKFCGLVSYNLNFKNGTVKTSFVHYIKMFGIITLYVLLIVNFLKTDGKAYSPQGKSVLIYGLAFLYFFQYVSILSILIFNFVKRGNVEKFLKLLETFDDHSGKMGWKFKVNHEQNYWSSVFWIVISLILLIGVATIQILWVKNVEHSIRDYIRIFFYCNMSNTSVLSSLQFIFGVQSVASRFEILNENTK